MAIENPQTAPDGAPRASGLRRSRRVFGVLAAFLLVPLVGLAVYAQTDSFRSLLVARAVELASSSIAGTLRVEASEGSIWGRVVIHGIDLEYDDRRVAHIDSLAFDLSFRGLLRGWLQLSEFQVSGPRVFARQSSDGSWDVLESLSPPAPPSGEPPEGAAPAEPFRVPFTIRLDELVVRDGAARLEPRAGEPVRVTGIRVDGSARALLESVRFEAGLDAVIEEGPKNPRIDLGGELVARLRSFGQEVEIKKLTARTNDSSLRVSGRVRPMRDIDLAIVIERLATRDLARAAPSLARLSDFEGRAEVRGPWRESELTGRLAWAAARLDVAGKLDLSRPEDSKDELTARLEVDDLARWLPGAGIAGFLRAKGEARNGDVQIESQLGHPGGLLGIGGTLSLPGVSEFDLAVRMDSFDPARIFPAHPEWQGSLGLAGRAVGAGLDPSEMRGALDFEIESSQIGRLAIDGGMAALRVSGGKIELPRLEIHSSTARLTAKGQAGFTSTDPLRFDAELAVADVAPFFALARKNATGKLEGEVRLSGTRDDARVEGDLRLVAFALDASSIDSVRFALDFRGLPSLPLQGEGHVSLLGIESPYFEGDAALDFEGTGADRQAFEASVVLAQKGLGGHRFETEGHVEGQSVEVAINRATIASPGGDWGLVDPVVVRGNPGALAIGLARFESNGAFVEVEGELRAMGDQRLRIDARTLPLEYLTALAGLERETGGRVDLDFALMGTAAQPEISARLVATELQVEGQPFERIEAEGGVRGGSASFSLSAQQSARQKVRAQGVLAVALSWDPVWVASPRGDLVLDIASSSFSLAPFEPLVADFVQGLGGEADLHLRVLGPLDDLRPEGEIVLRGVTFRPKATGVTVEELEAVARIESNVVTLESFAAKAGVGRLEASGHARITPKGFEALDVKLEADRWPLIKTAPYALTSSGNLTLAGATERLRLGGNVQIIEGTLRPSLDFLVEAAPARDPTIVFESAVDSGSSISAGVSSVSPAPPREESPPLFDRMELDVAVGVPNNLWIKHKMASIEFGGAVKIEKAIASPVSLSGRMNIHRGWVNLQARRFRLIEGDIAFVGGHTVDPQLNVLARYKTSNYTVDARVTGLASAPSLELTSDPSLEQADILAVLIFGRPINDLDDREQASLGDQTASMASAYGMTAAGNAVAAGLGLDEAGLQIDELSEERASVAAYLGRRTSVAVTQEFQEERGQKYSVEYEFWPGWSVVTSTTSGGNNAADLVWRIRY